MKKIILWMLGLLVVGVLAGYGIGYYLKESRQPGQRIPIAIEPELPPRDVQLYFADPRGRYLIPEDRQIRGCDDDRECIISLLSELARGSQRGGLAVVPEQARILAVELENDLVRVDFSRQLVDQHPGGSLSELLTVYSLANSLVENFSYLRQLQILVDGRVQQTLKGHVRIDQPVYADFSYSRPPLPGLTPQEEAGGSVEQDVKDE